MTELRIDKHLQAARREVRVRAWDASRVEAGWRELGLRRHGERERRRRVAMIGGTALAAALVVLVLFALRVMSPSASEGPSANVAPALVRLALGDATQVRFRQGTRLDVKERTESRVVVTVGQGTAHFNVRHDPRRLFRVEAGAVEVEDLGTTFEVENRGNSVRVSVSEGSVQVSFPDAAGKRAKATLEAGQSGSYPAVLPPTVAPPRAPDAPVPASSGASQASVDADWRELARAGKHRRAYELMAAGGFRDVRNDPGDLLLASDVARLSRHPAEAATLLRKLLAGHERDARAPSAAFTLGWVLMNELGRPREAALAFARAEALAPRGNLAEDAMARAVEAWYRAGELGRAKAEAERYKKAYPQGRHQATLARLVTTP
jgi:transmembrane sensor